MHYLANIGIKNGIQKWESLQKTSLGEKADHELVIAEVITDYVQREEYNTH